MLHLSLPGQKRLLLVLDAPHAAAKGTHIAEHLKKWDITYFGKVRHVGSNLRKKLLSKRFETAQRTATVLKSRKYYADRTPGQKAKLAREALSAETEVVDWPTKAELKMGTLCFAERQRGDDGISADDVGGTCGSRVNPKVAEPQKNKRNAIMAPVAQAAAGASTERAPTPPPEARNKALQQDTMAHEKIPCAKTPRHTRNTRRRTARRQ